MAAITGGFDDNEYDVEFLRSEAAKMYGGVNPERWERIREQDFLSIAEEITGQRCLKNSFVRCPFHGADSTPSFKVYENDAYCFGCDMFFDAIALVAKHQDCNRFKALLWLENYYNLPPMADTPAEDEEVDDEERELKFSEVEPRYIKFASAEIQKLKNAELAEEYLRYYFEGKQNDDVMPLLAVLGPDRMAEIAREYGLE
jgi:hypothetical protein